ncbi:BglG family transcription antiterminator [Oceanobacillus oncorhynchi subsp. oncorhynchi]|uniref:BglG family transcription antiterminator n=1 Tax=Oceanobacillus oncorhynchi TaxID=545501 RepID=UPI0031D218FC
MKVNKKQRELLDILSEKNDEWVNSKDLAEYFNCSTRTIRNYVSTINSELSHVIESSNIGYKLNKNALRKDQQNLSESKLKLNDRKSRIFLEMLKNSSSGIDLFELSEKLFISESTLKNDIQELKQSLPSQTLRITIKGDLVKLEGSEHSKRKYMVDLLYDEGNSVYDELKSSIEQMIEDISLDEIKNIIRSTLSNLNIFINQYSLNNIVLHFAISMERIRQGYILTENDQDILKENLDKQELTLTNEITKGLAEKYNVHFPESEIYKLALQFVGLYDKSLIENNNEQQVEAYVDSTILSVLRDVLRRAEDIYLIDFEDNDFINKLAIHLQGLFYRSQFQKFNRNSNLLDIKISYPIIYDISVYIASLIQEKIDITFNEDEISFIALHIGSLLEKEKAIDKNYIRILLIANDYHGIRDQITKKIKNRLGSSVQIQSVSDYNDNQFFHYDLLVTTDRKVATTYEGSVFIKPFLTDRDLIKIEKRVDVKKKQHQKDLIDKLIKRFFSESLYFNQIDPSGLMVSDIIKHMNQMMIAERYVDENFYYSVQRREKMSPTSFPSGIAVPHSVELDALKSGISILTLQEPIIWSNQEIKVVALVAINKKESKKFNKFFELFIEIVSESYNVEQLRKSENCDEYITKLKMMADELIDKNILI